MASATSRRNWPNPAFFSAENTALIALFRELGDQGVLRLGGGTSEFTAFTTEEAGGPPLVRIGRRPDTSKNVKTDTPIMPRSLRNLRAFLDATGWRCLYGLNLGRGPVRARRRRSLRTCKAFWARASSPCNWATNRMRGATAIVRPRGAIADYWKEWSAAHAAIVARVPGARFAGPDAANKMDFVTGFAAT